MLLSWIFFFWLHLFLSTHYSGIFNITRKKHIDGLKICVTLKSVIDQNILICRVM